MKKKSFKALAVLMISFFIVSFAGMACTGSLEAQDRKYSWGDHIRNFFHHFYHSLQGEEDNQSDYPLIVQELADKLELDPEKVMEAFEDLNGEKKKRLEENFREKLSQAVKEGVITEEQKEAIIAKREEVTEEMQRIRELPVGERSEAIEDMIDDLKHWAEENNVNIKQLFPLMRYRPVKVDRFIRRHNFKFFK